jgi:hypothetical protein
VSETNTITNSLSRTLRLRPTEAELVDAFLSQNSLLDFSTLARVAILQFIKNPRVDLVAVSVDRTVQTKITETITPKKFTPINEAIQEQSL